MKKTVLFLLLFIPLTHAGAIEEGRIRTTVLPLKNMTGTPEYDKLCDNVTEILSLVAQFQKNYYLVEGEGAPAPSETEEFSAFIAEHRIDRLYYGSLIATGLGTFIFTIHEYDADQDKITLEFTETAESLFDIFDAADLISRKAAEHLGSKEIGFGSLSLKKEGGQGRTLVYLDGYPLPHAERVFEKILMGSYDLSLRQERLTGETVVFETTVDIEPGERTEISYTLPATTPEELKYFAQLITDLNSAGENSGDIETFLDALASFQEKTRFIDYDPVLLNEAAEQMEEAGEAAAAVLGERLASLDAQFYQEFPDFKALAGEYRSLETLISPRYGYDSIEEAEGEALAGPVELLRTRRGDLFVALRPGPAAMERMKTNLPLAKIPDTAEEGADQAVLIAVTPRGEFSGATLLPSLFRWSSDGSSRLYTYVPGSGELKRWKSGLESFRTLPIPDPPEEQPERMDFTISEEEIVYLFFDDEIRIFSTDYDPREEEYPFRYTAREEVFVEALSRLPWNPARWQADGAYRIHVSDELNRQILVTDLMGTVQGEITLGEGTADGSLWIDRLGYYFLSDPEEHQIRKYTPRGEFLNAVGKYGTRAGEFSVPRGGAVDDEGKLFIADSYNSRIQILTPQTPPLLVPNITGFNAPIQRRIERSEKAERRITALEEEIDSHNSTAKLVLGSLLTAGAAGAMAGFDVFSALAVDSYEDYRSATTVDAVNAARDRTELFQGLGGLCLFGTMPLVTFGSGWLFDGILNTARDHYLRSLAYEHIQGQDLDLLYTLDEEQYRSLRKARAIGIWTGVVPGILSAGLTIAEISRLFSEEDVNDFSHPLHYANMALIGIPPLGSHLYAGRFSPALFVTSLVADALAAGAYFYYKNDAFRFESQETETYSGDTFDLGRTLTSFEPLGGVYMLLAASAIRLTAGLFDARYGWLMALEHNSFEAQTGTPPPEERHRGPDISFNASPMVTPRGELGIAAQISWR